MKLVTLNKTSWHKTLELLQMGLWQNNRNTIFALELGFSVT